jgi:hypothetical protein
MLTEHRNLGRSIGRRENHSILSAFYRLVGKKVRWLGRQTKTDTSFLVVFHAFRRDGRDQTIRLN